MTGLPEFDFIPRVRAHYFHQYPIKQIKMDSSTNIQLNKLKWMARWTDLYNPLHGAGYCLHPEFHAYNHTARTKALTDLYTM